MASLEAEEYSLVNQLASDTTVVIIHTNGPDVQAYHIQKTVLTVRAAKLAEGCIQQHIRLDVSSKAFRIFFAWLQHGDINKAEQCQLSLAQAWNFGNEYQVRAFQDATMQKLIASLKQRFTDPPAVLEAYKVTARGTFLQRAFAEQLAIDMCSGSYAWDRETFTDYGLEKVPTFNLDLMEALRRIGEDAVASFPPLKPADFQYSDVTR